MNEARTEHYFGCRLTQVWTARDSKASRKKGRSIYSTLRSNVLRTLLVSEQCANCTGLILHKQYQRLSHLSREPFASSERSQHLPKESVHFFQFLKFVQNLRLSRWVRKVSALFWLHASMNLKRVASLEDRRFATKRRAHRRIHLINHAKESRLRFPKNLLN